MVCASCGRDMPKGSAGKKYCSQGCRTHRPGKLDRALESAIAALLATRGVGKTICPSEASRQVFGEEAGLHPDHMEQTRRAARRMVAAGALEIVQKNQVVDPSTARGPIRLRLRRSTR